VVQLLFNSGVKLTSKTNASQIIRILFLLALPLAVCSSGSAATLQGKVTDVIDGESIAILSQTHTLKVKLIGVAAPEKDQAYAGVARQHLADLILNKFVMVRYSALRDGYLVGQVWLTDMDVCAQMLRDGAAWYKSHEGELSELDRQIYEASQTAARNERRGLWQEDSPQSPWDFRNAQLPMPTPSLQRQSATSGRGRSVGLSSEDLMNSVRQSSSLVSSVTQPSSFSGQPDFKKLSSDGGPGRWLKYQPEDRHFSVLARSDGVEMMIPVVDGQGHKTDVHHLIGSDNGTLYLMTWAKGKNGISTDASAAADTVNAMLSELNRVRGRLGIPELTATPGRSLRVDGYDGRQYSLTAGSVSGVVRVLSKQIGDEREVFLLGVLNRSGAGNTGEEFFDSLKIRQN
jgi:endonuclease YncB( thermonuclease family)